MIIIIPTAIIAIILIWVLRPPKRTTPALKTAILAVIVPAVLVAVTAIALQLSHNSGGNTGVSDASNICFIVSLGLIVASLLALFGSFIVRKYEIARGIGFSACIAVLVSIVELAALEGLAGV